MEGSSKILTTVYTIGLRTTFPVQRNHSELTILTSRGKSHQCIVEPGFKIQEAVQDQDIMRDGLLFTLSKQNFVHHLVYRYHNE